MKKWGLVLLTLLFAVSFALAACGGGGSKDDATGGNNNNNAEDPALDKWKAVGDPNLSGKITIWAVNAQYAQIYVEGFNKYYPNVEVEVINQGFDVTPKTQVAIAAGKGGPDIVLYHYNETPTFNSGEGLVDLLQEPYNAGQYKDGFTEANWHRWLSFDGKSMYALPGQQVPKLTWYRQDILEEYGFPTDPEELGEYIQDRDNYLNIAKTFKAEGKWITTIRDWDVRMVVGDAGFFDENLKYYRGSDNELLVDVINLTKEMYQLGLISNLMVVWSDDANRELNAGNIPMLTIEANFGSTMEEIAPDTEGKWLVTKLPLGWKSAGQGVSMSILEQSKNKEAAWAFIKYAQLTLEGQQTFMEELGTIPALIPAWDLPYLQNFEDPFTSGNQNTWKIAVEELKEIQPQPRKSSLDKKANEIWTPRLDQLITENLDTRATLDSIQQEIEAAVSQDMEKMKEQLGLQ